MTAKHLDKNGENDIVAFNQLKSTETEFKEEEKFATP